MSRQITARQRILLGLLLVFLLAVVAVTAWRWWSGRSARILGPSELQLDALILLQQGDAASVRQATDWITTQGGQVYNFFPPLVLLATIPPAADTQLTGQAGIAAIHRSPISGTAMGVAVGADLAAQVWSNMLRRNFRSSLSRNAPPRQVADEFALVAPEKLREPSIEAMSGASPDHTSDFLFGSIRLEVFLLESNGKQDVNREDWTVAQRDKVAEEVVAGANWWLQTATTDGKPPAHATFTFAFHDPWTSPAEVTTRYEPINRPWQDISLAIAEAMGNVGYADSNWIGAVRSYLNDQRRAQGNDWAVAVFLVNSAHDPDGAFSDRAFAFSYLSGPCIVLTYDCSGWGLDSMEIVIAHELAHAFGALDEYAGSPFQPDDTAGYLNVVNSNSENGTAVEDSIMRGPASLFRAYQRHLASTAVRGMLGWRDSDGDGWYDVAGNARNDLVASHANPVLATAVTYDSPRQRAWMEPWRYQGLSRWTTSIGISHVPVSINSVRDVVYRVDEGPWQSARPRDGAFDSNDEGYLFSVEGLTTGKHTVDTAVVNAWGGKSAMSRDILEVVVEGTPEPVLTPTLVPGTPEPSLTAAPGLNTPEPSPAATLAPPTPGPTSEASPSPTITPLPPTATATPRPPEIITLTLQNGLWDYSGCTDTRISAEVPDFQFGSADLKVGTRQKLATLIQFDLTSIPTDAVIDAAWLSLFGYGREGSGKFDIEIYAVNRPWQESEATWKLAALRRPWTQVGCEGVPGDRVDMPSGYVIVSKVGWYTWDVGDDVQRMVAQPQQNAGWLLKQSTMYFGSLSMCSSEHGGASLRPKLVITYHVP